MADQAITDPFGLVGTILDGQYRVDQVVGEGGYGVVYRGWHQSLEQPIAIKALKVLAEDPKVQEALLAKFKDEAKLLYTLSQASLHIVRAIDFGAVLSPSGAWAPYMVLEWLEGRSLADDLAERHRRGLRGRSLEETLALLAPAAEGLSLAHQRRVAHRDVKPGNFFVLSGQGSAGMKVLDFGIAKMLREGEQGGTKSPFASFTWLYAAPEQLDPRYGATGLYTDVYSFALVLAELLTDRSPIEGRDVVAIIKAVTDPAVRPTPRTRGANVPDAVEAACRRALAVDPNARFATIGELWAALTSAASQRPSTLVAPASTARSSVVTPPPSSMSGLVVTPTPTHTPTRTQPQPARPSVPQQPLRPSQPQPQHARPPSPSGPPLSMGPPIAPYSPALAPPHPPPHPMPAPYRTGAPHHPVWKIVPTQASSAPIVLAIIAVVLSGLFVVTCSVYHAACN